MANKKIRVAVTGGMGSGKSEFCRYIESKGYPVLKADDISKEFLAKDLTIRKKIIKAFGEESYNGEVINTRYLAETVFSDIDKLVEINSILHPAVIKKIDHQMNLLFKANQIVFVEAAIIIEAEMDEMFDYIILVTADDSTRINRILKQGKLTEEEIRKRIETQMPDEEKKRWCDFVFENNSDIKNLYSKADFLLALLKSVVSKEKE